MYSSRKEKIIAVIPAYKEEGKIGLVAARIKKEAERWIDEILVVDDGSKDNTAKEAEGCGATVLRHTKNMGAGAAIRTGIDYALKNKYDIVVVMGGDNQDNPGEIKRVVYPIVHDHFDFVQGSRYMAGGERVNIPLFRWITTGIYSLIFKIILRFPVSDGTNGFRAFRLDIFRNKNINLWQDWLNHYELEPYLFYKAIEYNFKVTEAPVTKSYPVDNVGYTKMIPFLDWWSILKPLFFLKLKIRK
ncbi:MAG: glycosyltransferase family 2 protein [Candidatus Omnitrophica bacterium]|nr:glycosyltransferase family 2 protein [Candidatus Omnitrophota bacterium]